MGEMRIQTFGRTAEITVTDKKIRETQREIGAVRRIIRKRPDWQVSYEEAREIALHVARISQGSSLHARAIKLQDRMWRARRRLAA